ncbi:MAG: hypothetical protein ABH879_08420 [archaeon]
MIKTGWFWLVVFGLTIGTVRTQYAPAWDEVLVHVNVENSEARDIKDVQMTVQILDLNLYWRIFPRIDIKDGTSAGRMLALDMPAGIKKGIYLTRITASNDVYRDVRHAWLPIM